MCILLIFDKKENMMKRIIALLLALPIIFTSLTFTVLSDSVGVIELYGQPSVFLSTFGKVTVDEVVYDSYRNFNEAVSAISAAGGGNIYFTGTINMAEYTDIEGRQPVHIIGAITKDNQNIIEFGESGVFDLKGSMSLSEVNFKSGKPVTIKTNGHSFKVVRDADVYFLEQYVPGNENVYKYDPAPSVYIGSASEVSGSVELNSGRFETVSGGTFGEENIASLTRIKVGGDSIISQLIAGNNGNGSMTGNITSVVGGDIGELIAGTKGGNVSGDIKVYISGGKIGSVSVGAAEGADIKGCIIVEISGSGASVGEIKNIGAISGKSVLVLKDGAEADISAGVFDYIVRLDNGSVLPVMSGGVLSGFKICDKYGIAVSDAVINGVETAANEEGLFTIPAGDAVSEISVSDTVEFSLNAAAKYVSGYDDGSFLPQNNMTRTEAITLLSRLIIDENLIKGKVTSGYKDVLPGSWYEPYIGLFESLGFLDEIDSTGGISIYPQKNITRGEFVQLIYELAQISGYEESVKLSVIPDISNNTPNAAAIFYAASLGIVNGYEDGTFRPFGLITRAEVVAIVNRFIGREPLESEIKAPFYDIDGHWAQPQIIAACGNENTEWTAKKEDDRKYIMPGTDTKTNVISLYEQSPELKGDAIREGVDMIAEQMKENIINSPDTLEETITGTKYYLSSENGDNSNDGLSPETAWKNYTPLKKVELKPGDGVFFERGGVYRGQLTVSEGVTYAAYGTGNKPVLMQSARNYANDVLWAETDVPNVWRLKLSVNNVGIIAFDHDITEYGNYDELYGKIMNYNTFGFMDYKDLKNDLEFYNDLNSKTLYLYSSEGNPAERFSSIEIGEKVNIISGSANDVHIDNLCVMFTGAHGMGSGTTKNRRVTNCIFSWLGGSVHSTNEWSGAAINYGNAVEIYGGCDGYYVENNWMYQIYDTGITHQYGGGSEGDNFQENIEYYGNLIEHVFWGIEVYNSPVSGTERKTSGVHISHNVLRSGGDSWGSYVRFREKSAPLYSVTSLSENSDELTEYNIFDRCEGYLINVDKSSKETDDKNIYIQTIGNSLGNLKGIYRDCGYDAAANIEEFFGDKNAVVVAVKP